MSEPEASLGHMERLELGLRNFRSPVNERPLLACGRLRAASQQTAQKLPDCKAPQYRLLTAV